MFGFGDDQVPFTESVDLLEDLVVEYITEMVRKTHNYIVLSQLYKSPILQRFPYLWEVYMLLKGKMSCINKDLLNVMLAQASEYMNVCFVSYCRSHDTCYC